MGRVTLLLGDKGNVDFEGPILMDDGARSRFLALLRKLFDQRVVEEVLVDDVRTERIGDRSFQRPWSPQELAILLDPIGTEEMSSRLGRTWMSLVLKRGEFYGPFLEWIHKKHKDLLRGDLKKLIEEYLDEKRILLTAAHQLRLQKRRRLRDLERELTDLKLAASRFDKFPWNRPEFAEKRAETLKRIAELPGGIAEARRDLEEETGEDET